VPSEQAETVYDAQVRGVLAQVLQAAADAIGHVAAVTSGAEAQDAARTEVDRRLSELHRRRDRLAELLLEAFNCGHNESIRRPTASSVTASIATP